MPFGVVRGISREIGVLDGGGDRRSGRGRFGGELGASHCNQRGLCYTVVQERRALPKLLCGRLVIITSLYLIDVFDVDRVAMFLVGLNEDVGAVFLRLSATAASPEQKQKQEKQQQQQQQGCQRAGSDDVVVVVIDDDWKWTHCSARSGGKRLYHRSTRV